MRARSGSWTADGWEAWQWLPGAADETRVQDVLRAGDAFHSAVAAPSQIVHGDLLGNVLFAHGYPPTIIDWAPYWRPVGYASSIVLADATCWHGLPLARMREFADGMAEGAQLLIRALVFRIATLHLLGVWDDEQVRRHAPVVDAAL